MNEIKKLVNDLRAKPFIQSIINDLNGEVWVVGGVVRDLILNKPNKDIDLVVRKISIDTLISQLQKFGKVDLVGKSFGVLKFINGDGVDYDIALPRKDKSTGKGGHKGFEIQSNKDLRIEDDLIRRDAKINAMAININNGKFIDPLGGLNDIENKQISAANSEAFNDDPLRMLRMVGFAARFNFKIEPETFTEIVKNAYKIKEITPERYLMELDKIVQKGNPEYGAKLLKETKLFEEYFNIEPNINHNEYRFVKTISEFLFLLLYPSLKTNIDKFYKKNLKIDNNTEKEIKAYEYGFNNVSNQKPINRGVIFNMYKMYAPSVLSQILPQNLQFSAKELLNKKYPLTYKDLAINGNDIKKMEFKNEIIGKILYDILIKIFADKLKNNEKDISIYIKNNYKNNKF